MPRVIRIPATCAAGTDVHSGCEMLPRGRARASPGPLSQSRAKSIRRGQRRYSAGILSPEPVPRTKHLAWHPYQWRVLGTAAVVGSTSGGRGGCP